MRLPFTAWRRTHSILGKRPFRVPFGDQTARINDRLDSEQLELRAMPSASVSMAWAAGATVEGQYQAISAD